MMNIFNYPYLIAIIVAWVVAQGLKYILMAKKGGSVRHIYLSGNMPSAHSATAVSLATVVGLANGFDSALFGIAAFFAGVVMYDAVMVRRSSGEQGQAIHELIKEQKSNVKLPRAAKGHEPIEVLAGAALGVGIGIIVFITT